MKREKTIKIHLLGEFLIENKEYRFPNKVKKSTQLITLIAYLIMNRHTSLTKEALVDLLWPNSSSENPEGALRNLIYRARKELDPFCKDQKKSCILSKGNSYSWNNDLPWDIDILHLERECVEMEAISNVKEVTERCSELLNTYGISFLHDFHDDWILEKRRYYSEMIQRTILYGCTLAQQNKDSNAVLKICDYTEFKHYEFPEMMEAKLRAFYELKQYAQAISYYHKIVEQFTIRYNIEVTQEIKEIYQDLLKYHKEDPENIEDLMEDLSEEVNGKGAFYCDMDVFRSLFQMNVRAAQRGVVSCLVMLRLKVVTKSCDVTYRRAGEQLKEILYRNLRRNDVFAHCSSLSYGAILQVPDKKTCVKVLERIKEKFSSKTDCEQIYLLYDIKEIQ